MKHEVTSLNTKKTFAESLKKLLCKKELSKITVSEIVADCGVNRKTFYYHFEDIYDLLKWTLEKEAVEVVKHFNLLTDYEEAIMFVMDYIEENDYIINCTYDALGRDGMKFFFFSDFKEIILSLITSAEEVTHVSLDEKYKSFLCSFYIDALSGLLIEWIRDRKHRDRKQLIDFVVLTVRTSLVAILEKHASDNSK